MGVDLMVGVDLGVDQGVDLGVDQGVDLGDGVRRSFVVEGGGRGGEAACGFGPPSPSREAKEKIK